MKLIPTFFCFFRKNLTSIRWGVFLLACVSCVLLFCHFPSKLEHYWTIEKSITILQIARGGLSSIEGYDNWTFQIARVLLPFCFAWGAIEVVGYLFIRFFTWFAISRWFCGHTILFGIGEKGFALAKELLKRGHTVVAIDKDAANPYLNQIERAGGFALVGDATDINFLKTLGLCRATAFYVMTGDDTVNIKSAVRLKEYFQNQKTTFWNRLWKFLCGFKDAKLSARVQVHDPILRRLAWEEGGPFAHASICESTKISWVCYPFSVYDQTAKMIVEEFSPDAAEGGIAGGRTKKYHVVIVGFGWFGERIALQVMRMCQTPQSLGHALVINVIDCQADFIRERFYQRYPAADPGNADDPRYGGYAPLAQFNFIQGDILRMNEKDVRTAIPDIDENTVIYVCLADELLGAEAAMSLAKITQESGTRIVFALPETERLSKEMMATFKKYNINMFFTFSTSCLLAPNEQQLGETIDKMGKAVLRTYYGSSSITELEKSWSESPEWGRESCRQSASHVFFKLRMIGIDSKQIETIRKDEAVEQCLAHLELLMETEHDRWSTERLLDGWTYGKTKDTNKRQHPDIQPFATLNKGTQDIDREVNLVIPEVLEIWQKVRK